MCALTGPQTSTAVNNNQLRVAVQEAISSVHSSSLLDRADIKFLEGLDGEPVMLGKGGYGKVCA
jgi:hypothetical protein